MPQLNLTYCYIKSPIDGRVGLRQVDPGNYVTAASGTAMLVITQLASHRCGLHLA